MLSGLENMVYYLIHLIQSFLKSVLFLSILFRTTKEKAN